MDYIGATPMQNPIMGLLAQRLKQAQEFATKPFGYSNPPAEMILNLLGVPAVQQTAERIAYGEPLTTGRGMTTQIRPEAVEAALTVAPVAGLLGKTAERGAMAAGRAGERLAEKYVPQIMEQGGLPAQLLGDLSYGSRSQVVPVDVAKQIDMPVALPQSKEFLKAVENEPSAQITDQGLLMNVRRMQTPEQSGAESVRTGVFYLPEGQSANLKHYKGKTGYGGAEAIEGETLYKNPLFVKGATGGKAPEAAYDSLMGKGAYENMRSEVLKSYGYNSNQSQKVEAVQGLLEKYNGLDSDDAYNMAYNIVSNSKGGNTLPYAVQENIVGHAVRNAGHDAVLGYGKGRGDKGEFFSEVFDVREYSYPDAYGGYELMPEIEKKLKSNLLETAEPSFVYPQEEALRLAQQRAALPISEGGLGLKADNTAAERAKAMGFQDVYHGTTQGRDKEGFSNVRNIWATDNPKVANTYATNRPDFGPVQGKAVMPLSVRVDNPMVLDARGQSWQSVPAVMPNEGGDELFYTTDKLAKLARQYGNDSLVVNNVFDVGSGRIPTSQRGTEALTGTTYSIFNPENVRSQFAAFDPWRKTSAIAAAMGVAAPDLLAEETKPKKKRKNLLD